MSIVIDARNLSKSFGNIEALKDFSLSVEVGKISGIVGPDGAGKTTAMRILSTVSIPDIGELYIDGRNAIKNYRQARQSLGYMSQKFGLYVDMTVEENINFFAELHGVPKRFIKSRAEVLLNASGMLQFANRAAGKLSGGMKQKLALCCALIHEPKILILDEPTNGVDPVSRREFWQILNKFTKSGTSVVYATSYLDEAERCNSVNLMNKGEIIASGSIDELKSIPDINVIEIKGDKVRDLLKNFPSKYGKLWSFGSVLHLHAKKDDMIINEVRNILSSKYEVNIIEPVLEDIFTYLSYGDNSNE